MKLGHATGRLNGDPSDGWRYVDTLRASRVLGPYQALMLAVIEQALHELDSAHPGIREAAWLWFTGVPIRSRVRRLTLEDCCAVIDLDASALRLAVARRDEQRQRARADRVAAEALERIARLHQQGD